MSALSAATQNYLEAYTGYSTALPGEIFPDQAPQQSEENPTALPYAVSQSQSIAKQKTLAGVVVNITERVQISVVAETRADAETARDWIAAAIEANPGPLTVGSLRIHGWYVDDEVENNQPYEDGSDESARIVSIDIVGSYAP